MKPFDLEKALAGEPVVTRRRRQVDEVIYSASLGKVITVISGGIYNQLLNGSVGVSYESDFDLFMGPKKRTVWVNLYKNMASGYNRGFFYDTEELANKAASAGRIGGKAYQIEIEE